MRKVDATVDIDRLKALRALIRLAEASRASEVSALDVDVVRRAYDKLRIVEASSGIELRLREQLESRIRGRT